MTVAELIAGLQGHSAEQTVFFLDAHGDLLPLVTITTEVAVVIRDRATLSDCDDGRRFPIIVVSHRTDLPLGAP